MRRGWKGGDEKDVEVRGLEWEGVRQVVLSWELADRLARVSSLGRTDMGY